MNERIKREIDEMEEALSALILQREELQHQIDDLRTKINNKKCYDKYYRGTVNYNPIRSGVTCMELMGKLHCNLTKEELREYHRLKQAERRARVKRERGRKKNKNE